MNIGVIRRRIRGFGVVIDRRHQFHKMNYNTLHTPFRRRVRNSHQFNLYCKSSIHQRTVHVDR